jgi:hypothetical protein
VRDGRFKSAINIFNDLLAGSAGAGPVAAYFYLGEAYQATDDEQSAIHAYEEYLTREPIMAAYVQPRMAQM